MITASFLTSLIVYITICCLNYITRIKMKISKILFLAPTLFVLSNCTPAKPVYFHKMSCKELEAKITELEGEIKTEKAFQVFDSIGKIAATIDGQRVSNHDPYTGRIGNHKADLGRAENAFYAKGCHK